MEESRSTQATPGDARATSSAAGATRPRHDRSTTTGRGSRWPSRSRWLRRDAVDGRAAPGAVLRSGGV